MAGILSRTVDGIKEWIAWSWTYLLALWFLLVVFVVYILRGPLRLGENVTYATMFLNTLTPKFYVALTGTSSLISGLILIFEWWYFKKYGTSFIEQVSLNHISPLLGDTGNPSSEANGSVNNGQQQAVPECKVTKQKALCVAVTTVKTKT